MRHVCTAFAHFFVLVSSLAGDFCAGLLLLLPFLLKAIAKQSACGKQTGEE